MNVPTDIVFLSVLAILAFGGNIAATVIGQRMIQRNASNAQQAATDAAAMAVKVATDAALATQRAQEATARAEEAAATAQKQALEAATQLVETAKSSDTKLEAVVAAAKTTGDALQEISKTGKATHTIVNNDRTVMLTAMAVLTRRIAKDHPGDEDAQQAARVADDLAASARVVNLDPETKP